MVTISPHHSLLLPYHTPPHMPLLYLYLYYSVLLIVIYSVLRDLHFRNHPCFTISLTSMFFSFLRTIHCFPYISLFSTHHPLHITHLLSPQPTHSHPHTHLSSLHTSASFSQKPPPLPPLTMHFHIKSLLYIHLPCTGAYFGDQW